MRPSLAAIGFLLAASTSLPCAAQDAAPVPPPAVAEPAPENLAIAREIVDLAMPPDNRRAMMEQMSDTLFAQMRDGLFRSIGDRSNPATQQIFDRYLEQYRRLSNELSNDSTPAMMEAVARAYARQFSLDDLRQIHAFISTPAGTRYFRQATHLFSDPDVAEANRAYAARLFAALQPMMAELQREVEAEVTRRPRR